MNRFSQFISEASSSPIANKVQWAQETFTRIWYGLYGAARDEYAGLGVCVPLSSSLVQKMLHGKKIKFSGFHVTSPERLRQLLALEGTKKAISAMTLFSGFSDKSRKLSPSIIKDYGMIKTLTGGVWHHGVGCKIRGNVLIHRNMDIMSVPDENGRRWIPLNVFFQHEDSYVDPDERAILENLSVDTTEFIAKTFCSTVLDPIKQELLSIMESFYSDPSITKLFSTGKVLYGVSTRLDPPKSLDEFVKYHRIPFFRALNVDFESNSTQSYLRLILLYLSSPKYTQGQWISQLDPFMNFKRPTTGKEFNPVNNPSDDVLAAIEVCKKYNALLGEKRKVWKKRCIESYYKISQDAIIAASQNLPTERFFPLDMLVDPVTGKAGKLYELYDEAVVNEIEIDEVVIYQSDYAALPPDVFNQIAKKKVTMIPDDMNNYNSKVKTIRKTPEGKSLVKKVLQFVNNPKPFTIS